MKIVSLFNSRRVWGGEDLVIETIAGLLRKKGDSLYSWIRSNAELGTGLAGKLRAFFSGIYSPAAERAMTRLIEREEPDIVHVHNLYPLFSPAVLSACRQRNVPVVLHCHSYLLTCPSTFHFRDKQLCDKCLGGREYWCLLNNCRGSVFESAGYALRNAVARKFELFSENVTLFIVLSEFTRCWLIDAGFRAEQVVVLPNMISVPETTVDPADGEYAAFSGRMSPEKGVSVLLTAATQVPNIPVQLAGDGPQSNLLLAQAPRNVIFGGWRGRTEITDFYRKARFVVVPSVWHEPFGMVAIEAMSHGLPVIASRRGGLPEIVDDGVTGLLFEPGDAVDLADKMAILWNDKELCRRMGFAGREKVIRKYSEDVYYMHLQTIYRQAIEICNNKN